MPDLSATLPAAADAAASAAALLVPQRTTAGQAALARRTRELTPRQRTTLFMVDGKRSVDIVIALAAQAGASATDFFDLIALGLVATPRVPAAAPAAAGESSLLPSAQSLQGDSNWSQPPLDTLAQIEDGPLAEARTLLIRAVRSESPVAGTFTLLRLKRAASRAELEALLDEVEQRLRKPHRRVIAAQTLRHVRHLLSLPR